jgi:putative ABC transport system permease protein
MRTDRLFRQLAWRGLRANREVIIPYVLASILTIALFNVLASLVNNGFVRTRSPSLGTLITLGAGVTAVFSAVFLVYARSFLDKWRRREMALYRVLGLEKRQVARVLLWETVVIAFAALAGGLLTAALFGNLAFMGLNALMHLPVKMGYTLSWPVTLLTTALFGTLFLVSLGWQVAGLARSTPAQQLASQTAGEREPKVNVLVLLAAVAALAAGYGLSLTTKEPLAALQHIFVAILLVVAGTYGLFTSGSIFVLKALRANRRFYYRPQAFIATSGMLYRMRQNATGLANIAVLLTMTVVTLATTLTIFTGSEATLRERYPHQNELTLTASSGAAGPVASLARRQAVIQSAEGRIRRLTAQTGRRVSWGASTRKVSMMGTFTATGRFELARAARLNGRLPDHLMLLTADSFKALTGVTVRVPAGRALAAGHPQPLTLSALSVGDVQLALHPLQGPGEGGWRGLTDPLVSNAVVVVDGDATLDRLLQASEAAGAGSRSVTDLLTFSWETDAAGTSDLLSYARAVRTAAVPDRVNVPAGTELSYQSRALSAQEFYTLNGGFLFVGAFLGLVFSTGTVLITYFKQVSEGHGDRRRFRIMAQVGVDRDTIRRATSVQLVWMFFLPLGVAVVHTLFAYPIISRLLVLFGIVDSRPFFSSMVGVVLAVALLYYGVYRLTSGLYLGILQGAAGEHHDSGLLGGEAS